MIRASAIHKLSIDYALCLSIVLQGLQMKSLCALITCALLLEIIHA